MGDEDVIMSPLVGKPLLYFTSVFVSLGVLLFGYEQGVMSCLLTNDYFKSYFNEPSAAEIGTMVSILEIGALLSSLISGRLADSIGRRRSIRYGALLFSIGGCLQTLSFNFAVLITSRFISGLGIGILTQIIPVYQSEISPSNKRGLLACIEFTGNIIGYSVSIWTDYLTYDIPSNYSWRIPLSIQFFLSIILILGSFLIVESPRWLLNNDKDIEGIVVIADLLSNGDIHHDKAINEFKDIKHQVLLHKLEGETSYKYMFHRYKKRVILAMSAQAFAQLNGINVISYYAPLVFEQAGWKGKKSILMTGINSIFYILSTIPPWFLIDKWGRRPILLSGSLIMGFALFLISYFLYLNTENTKHYVVVLVIIFNSGFGYSWGPIPWLYPAEISPLSVRSKITSLSTASNWFFNWLIGEMTPILQELITFRLYLIHSTSCFISFLFVFYFYPETAGITLEDMDSLFNDQSSTLNYNASIYETISQTSENNSLFIHNESNNIIDRTPRNEIQTPELNDIISYKQQSRKNSILRRSSSSLSLLVGKVFKKT